MTFSILGTDTQTNQHVELPQASRREGLYIIGATGTGKSTLLENLILQDINQGLGVCVLDPHGDLVNAVLSRMKKRLEDVILIDLGSRDYVAGLHLFHCEHPDNAFEAENVVQAVMHILEKVYQISRDTPLMNQYFINIAKTLIYHPQATVLDIPRLLTDATFRASLLAHVPDDDVHWFWTELYEQQRRGRRSDEILSMVTDKLVEFNSRVLKPWFGQNRQTLNLRRIMDERKILLVKLKARWQSMTSLIGSIFIAQILDAAYSREDTRVNKRKQFNVYADEFQTFASQDFAQLFTEARKYGIGITISHQVFEQIDLTIKATIKQAANIIVFRVSADNAKEIAGEFDCTPPPGEWIYEKIMRKAGEPYEVSVWDSPEAEQRYSELGEELAWIQQQQSTNQDIIKQDVLTGIYSPFHLTKQDYENLPTVSKDTSVERIRWLFFPESETKEAQDFFRSFYEVETQKIKYGRVEGSSDRYNYRTYYDRKKQKEQQVIIPLPEYHFPDGYYRALKLAAPIQSGVAYSFPVDLQCVFEYYITHYKYWEPSIRFIEIGNQYRQAVLGELQQIYRAFKPHAKYYFNFDKYDEDYGHLNLEFEGNELSSILVHTLASHWKGPYFDTDEPWRVIIDWMYQTFARLLQRENRVAEILEERNRLFKQYQRLETRIRYLGWYEPEPVIEWEELAHVKALMRDFGEDFMVGDNTKYKARRGPPPYGTDEVEKRIANQIKLLPKFTARVRIASGEYTITTEKPSGYSNEQELQKRIQTIHDQNKKEGYIRLRADVEAELVQRRQPVLASPRVTQQQSPRRVARQVLVKGNCPNCGTSNAPSSKFCNQCGQPL